jgi:hypothetical protein
MDETTFVEKEPLILREYGRNVQKLVQYITTLKTVEERTQASHALINLMKQLNPSVRENNDNMQRVWDHLHHMANFELDINSPYPVPTPENIYQKPQALAYTTGSPKYRHYGRNIELLVEKAAAIEDQELLLHTVKHILQMMKSFYVAWNNDNIEDEVLLSHIRTLSAGKINISASDLQDGDAKNYRKPYHKHQNSTNRNPNNNRPHSHSNPNKTVVENKGVENRVSGNRKPNNRPQNTENTNRANNGEKRNPYPPKDKNFKK